MNIKKTLISLSLIGIITLFFALPLVSFAGTPQDCCKLRHDLSDINGQDYVEGDVVKSKSPGAQCDLTPGAGGTTYERDDWGLVCMLDTIVTATDWIFYFLVSIAVLMIIMGGVTIMTSAGSIERANKGKNYIIYAIAGLAIALIAKAIPALVKAIMGV